MLPNKRVRIRPPKRTLTTQIDFDRTWAVLADAITQIERKNASKLLFEDLYRRAYNLVLRKQGARLYDHVAQLVQQHLLTVRQRLLATECRIFAELDLMNAESLTDQTVNENWLRQVVSEWEDHILCMRLISDVLMYLDRVYAKENKRPLIYDVGLNCFRDYVVKYNNNEIGAKLTRIVNQEIYRSRQEGIINKLLIKSVINMLESLQEDDYGDNYYVKYFEPEFLAISSTVFVNISQNIMDLANGTVYIDRIHTFIKAEENRTMLYLPAQTFPKLIKLMDTILILDKLDKVLKFPRGGLQEWVDEDKYGELAICFELNRRIDAEMSFLKTQLREIILEGGRRIENDALNSKDDAKKAPKSKSTTQLAIKWIEDILKYKDKLDIIHQKSFQSNSGLDKSIGAAISEFINLNKRVAEYLCLFIDYNLKQMLKKSTKKDLNGSEEVVLDKSIIIFKFIRDKDLFERYYKNHLAKRLLQNKSISDDVEKNMISKLKQEMGSDFTKNLEIMFQDINSSRDSSTEFSKLSLGFEDKFDLEVHSLTPNNWPMKPDLEFCKSFEYPALLGQMKTAYDDFIGPKRNGKLVWLPMFGSIDMRIVLGGKGYEVNMSTYSGIIMLLFDAEIKRTGSDDLSLTYQFIRDSTQIPEAELKRQLQSIAVASKTRLLTKIPMTKEINEDDVFKLNEKFKSQMTKIKVLTVASSSKVEDEKEREETMEKLNELRYHQTDAAIVRIMKSRKTLSHNELLLECIKQLSSRFKPPTSLFKQRVEVLLEKEYLKRDDEDRGLYHYIA